MPKKTRKKNSGKKRGGRPGHKGHSRFLYNVSECESVLDHHPQTCSCCGETLLGEDAKPYRHQIVEIPPISPIIVEHRLHQLMCLECGTLTRATLPQDVYSSGYLWCQSSSSGNCVERTVPPQSKDGAECNARCIWDKHVFGYSQ
ncbi:IS66 family transposase zinc-finger binding domain-containing protein [Nostoc sp. XA013]|nr:IS66 family transposase zinc-finger binding domain-containing protein [Nostoc sp. XA013]